MRYGIAGWEAQARNLPRWLPNAEEMLAPEDIYGRTNQQCPYAMGVNIDLTKHSDSLAP